MLLVKQLFSFWCRFCFQYRVWGGGRTGSKLPPKPSCCPNSLRRVMMMMTFILILLLILMVVLMMVKADHHFTDIALSSPITNICQIISLSIVSGWAESEDDNLRSMAITFVGQPRQWWWWWWQRRRRWWWWWWWRRWWRMAITIVGQGARAKAGSLVCKCLWEGASC